MHNFCHNSQYAYANVMNFGEHDLHNIPHNFGIQHKVKFDHDNPNSFIESNNTKVFIQALHDAKFWIT
jgi:hypothetical protein